jgi:hypothetical protein
METAKRIAALLILVLLVGVPAQSMDKPRGSDTLRASCLLKVTVDPAVLPLDTDTVYFLVHSTGVAGKAIREVLDVSPGELPDDFLTVEELSYGSAGTGSWGLPPTPSATWPGRWLGDADAGGVESVDPTEDTGGEEREMMEESPAATEADAEPKGSAGRSSTAWRYRRGRWSLSRSPGRERLGSTSGYSDYPLGARYGRSYGQRAPRTSAGTPPVSPEQSGLFLLSVDLHKNLPPLAEELMAAIVDNFSQALMQAFEGHRNRLRGQLELAEEEVARTENELAQMQTDLRELSGRHGNLSRGAILADIDRLRSDLQRIKMDQASSDAVERATLQRIAEVRDKIDKRLEDDEITRQLQEIVTVSDNQLALLAEQYKSNVVSRSALAPAREKLAKARIELAKRREEMGKSTGGELINSLNKELADLSIKAVQEEAQIVSIEEQLKEARDLLKHADEYERDSLEADIAKRQLEEAIVLREQIARKSRLTQPPSVTVIGGD